MTYLEIKYDDYLRRHRRNQNKGARGTTDSERKKTYQAEFAYEKQVKGEILKFKDIEEVRKYAKKIYRSKTWQKLYMESLKENVTIFHSGAPQIVAKQRSTGRGTAGWTNGHKVTLDNKVGLNLYVLLHELTHCLGHMHHGRSFRKTLLKLVSAFLGVKHREILKKEFRDRKLSYGEAREPMSFETWKSAREKMLKAKEKKNDIH